MNPRLMVVLTGLVIVLGGRFGLAASTKSAPAPASPAVASPAAGGIFLPPTFSLEDLSTMRIRMKTSEGTMTFALDPTNAPKNAQQFAQIVYAGGYRDVPITQLQPGIAITVPGLEARPAGAKVPSLQLATLPLEAGKVKHARGVLSMAHGPFDKNSGRSGFYILLSAQPQMNGEYSVFGHLVEGDAVLKGMEKKILDSQAKHRPTTDVKIISTEIVKKKAKKG